MNFKNSEERYLISETNIKTTKKNKNNEKKIYGFRKSISLNKIIFLLQQQ